MLFPVAIIKGSMETAVDALIEEELFDRLVLAEINEAEIPDYTVESVELSTSDGRHLGRVKCIVSARQDIHKLQDMIMRITTPASRNKYLVTRDYAFFSITYPPTDTTDKEVMDALKEQRVLNASLIRTCIYGLTGIDPFRDVPEYTKGLCTREKHKNTGRTVAHFLLTMSMVNHDGRVINSPVTRVSTNPTGTKLYLHAFRTEAAKLIQLTKEVMNLLHIWYEKNNFRLKGDMRDAIQQSREVKPLTQMEIQAMNSRVQRLHGETSEAQQKLDKSRTRDEVIQTAKDGIDNTFTGSKTEATLGTTQETRHRMDIHTTSEPVMERAVEEDMVKIGQEILLVKENQQVHTSKIEVLTALVQTMLEKETTESGNKTLTTLSKLIESSTQSSLSSITEVATAVRTHVDENSTQIRTLISKNSEDILVVCGKFPAIDDRIAELQPLVIRQEQAAEKAAEAAKKTNEQQSLIIKLLESQQEYLRRLTESNVDASVDFGRNDDIQDTPRKVDDIEQTKNKMYTAEIREKARHVLALAKTMPYTRAHEWKAAETEPSTAEPATTGEGAAGLGVCKECGKRDYSLLYWDRCEDLANLYHAGCMTFVEGLAEYHCNGCYNNETEGHPSTNGGHTETNLDMQTSLKRPVFAQEGEGESDEKDNLDQTEMSISTSPSSASSISMEDYKPRYKRNTPRTKTLPSLKDAESNDRPNANKKINEISPLQTRAQRQAKEKAKKAREDAFNTSDEDKENNSK